MLVNRVKPSSLFILVKPSSLFILVVAIGPGECQSDGRQGVNVFCISREFGKFTGFVKIFRLKHFAA